jgi:hypothetical protein
MCPSNLVSTDLPGFRGSQTKYPRALFTFHITWKTLTCRQIAPAVCSSTPPAANPDLS